MANNRTTPPLDVKLTFDTAANLLDVLTAQSVHAQRAAEEGYPSLLGQMEKLMPLFHHLRNYVEKAS